VILFNCVINLTQDKDLVSQAGFEQITTRRSASMGEAGGISVYSVTLSARKPSGS